MNSYEEPEARGSAVGGVAGLALVCGFTDAVSEALNQGSLVAVGGVCQPFSMHRLLRSRKVIRPFVFTLFYQFLLHLTLF